MMFLSKEESSKDAQLKTQMFSSLTNDKSKGSQKIWKEFVFFGDQQAELTIVKPTFQKIVLFI